VTFVTVFTPHILFQYFLRPPMPFPPLTAPPRCGAFLFVAGVHVLRCGDGPHAVGWRFRERPDRASRRRRPRGAQGGNLRLHEQSDRGRLYQAFGGTQAGALRLCCRAVQPRTPLGVGLRPPSLAAAGALGGPVFRTGLSVSLSSHRLVLPAVPGATLFAWILVAQRPLLG
jgi:hypothetical protein